MSLDSLFQQILLTEQKAEEKRRLMNQVKQEIALSHEKIRSITEHLDEAKTKLDNEVQLLSEKFFSLELLKNREESLQKQKCELLNQKSALLKKCTATKKKIATEDVKFLKEITDFNNEYSLTSNREQLIRKRAKAEMCELQEKESILGNEIKSMEHKNAELKMFQQKKNGLKQELLNLQKKTKDLENEIREAKYITECLEMEKIQMAEKPQTDPECIRLKKELESYREDEMENACEALQTEIEFLQMMLGVWFAAIFLHVIVKGLEVCYDRLGCFENGPPWGGTPQRPLLGFPEHPDVVNTAFHLYTRENPAHFQEISADTPSTISVSNFRTNRRTSFIVHGYSVDNEDIGQFIQICGLLLQMEDLNCIIVNWEDTAAKLYTQAVQNIRIVGAELAYLLDYFEKSCGYSPSNVHIIGHSLGAHAGGEAGRRKQGINRITGLDPAGPLFHDTSAEVRLDPSDAKFVDVIHTNIGHLLFEFATGIIQPCGHFDFYPNGGKIMPGCKEKYLVPKQGNFDEVMREFTSSKAAECSHKRSLQYYSASIFIPDGFLGYRCDTFDSFLSGKCFPCPKEGCPMMGHHADTSPDKTKEIHQVFYLVTAASPPFACWRKRVSIILLGFQNVRGDIIIALAGTNEFRREYLIATGFLYPSRSYGTFLDVNVPGNITAVEFQWRKHPAWQRIGYIGAEQITLVNGKDAHRSVFCGSSTVPPEIWQKLTPC